jgi:hypothetical protein
MNIHRAYLVRGTKYEPPYCVELIVSILLLLLVLFDSDWPIILRYRWGAGPARFLPTLFFLGGGDEIKIEKKRNQPNITPNNTN